MSIFINCLNKFFKENDNITYISSKKILELQNKYNIGTYNILGILQGNTFNWAWSIPVFKYQDTVNEGNSYNYLNYGLTIFKNDNDSELNSFKLYTRYILTRSNIIVKSNYELIWLFSILNDIKKKNNIFLIAKVNIEGNLKKKNWEKNIKHIDYNNIVLNDEKHYYKIYEIPKKYLD